MNKNLFILVVLIMIFGCSKHKDDPTGTFYAKTYIKNSVSIDTANAYKGSYYIHVAYSDLITSVKKEVTFDQSTHYMTPIYDPTEFAMGMSIQGASFQDSKSAEDMQIAFYINAYPDSVFKICYANYIFGNLWTMTAGANIEYLRFGSGIDPNSFFHYQGINTTNSYFKITYIGTNRINGVFHTTWNTYGTVDSIYDVDGDFSIPRIR